MVAPFTLTRSTKGGYQALDVHTATEIGIDEAGFDEPVRSDDESGWDWHHPTVITMKSRQIAVGEKLLNVRSEPNRETERERVPFIEIGNIGKGTPQSDLKRFAYSCRSGVITTT